MRRWATAPEMMDPDIAAELDGTAELLRALAHPVRLQILHAVRAGPLAVGEIEEATGIGQPGLSQQLSILRKAELVRSERSGKQVFYQVDGERMAEVAEALAALSGTGAGEAASRHASAAAAGLGAARGTRGAGPTPPGGAARFARVFR